VKCHLKLHIDIDIDITGGLAMVISWGRGKCLGGDVNVLHSSSVHSIQSLVPVRRGQCSQGQGGRGVTGAVRLLLLMAPARQPLQPTASQKLLLGHLHLARPRPAVYTDRATIAFDTLRSPFLVSPVPPCTETQKYARSADIYQRAA